MTLPWRLNEIKMIFLLPKYYLYLLLPRSKEGKDWEVKNSCHVPRSEGYLCQPLIIRPLTLSIFLFPSFSLIKSNHWQDCPLSLLPPPFLLPPTEYNIIVNQGSKISQKTIPSVKNIRFANWIIDSKFQVKVTWLNRLCVVQQLQAALTLNL